MASGGAADGAMVAGSNACAATSVAAATEAAAAVEFVDAAVAEFVVAVASTFSFTLCLFDCPPSARARLSADASSHLASILRTLIPLVVRKATMAIVQMAMMEPAMASAADVAPSQRHDGPPVSVPIASVLIASVPMA